MKAVNAFAIFVLLVSIIGGLYENTITSGELIFRGVLIVANLACCIWGED